MDLSLMTDTLTKLWGQFVEVIPNFVGALTIFIVGFIIAKIVSRIVIKLLEKIQIDKFGEKLAEIDIFQKADLKIKLSKIFGKIKLIVGFIILIFGILLADGIRGIVETTLTSLGLPSAKMISSFLFYFLFVNVVISAIAQAEINTAFLEQNISIVIGGGILAFAIGYGMASKDSVGNFLASFYANGKVAIGDVVELDNVKGEIINMDKNSVTILSEDRHIVYPLKMLLNEKISIYK